MRTIQYSVSLVLVLLVQTSAFAQFDTLRVNIHDLHCYYRIRGEHPESGGRVHNFDDTAHKWYSATLTFVFDSKNYVGDRLRYHQVGDSCENYVDVYPDSLIPDRTDLELIPKVFCGSTTPFPLGIQLQLVGLSMARTPSGFESIVSGDTLLSTIKSFWQSTGYFRPPDVLDETYYALLDSVRPTSSLSVHFTPNAFSSAERQPNPAPTTVFPNPASEYLRITLGSVPPRSAYTIYDRLGKIQRRASMSEGSTELELDVRAIPSGCYTILIGSEAIPFLVRH